MWQLSHYHDQESKKSDLDRGKAKIVKATEGLGDRRGSFDPTVGGNLALQVAYFVTRLWHTGVPNDHGIKLVAN
ncbi:hypothetical protein EPI10_006324 [Gossypium australe]|uniref:Uncharacterized protein n=1 Tax=Gossypium australe TaxID=47621 RepID=A0A5B6WQS2_9ROSI|nr:hypothetical protein EPI10_006324 [Gossypium australe]